MLQTPRRLCETPPMQYLESCRLLKLLGYQKVVIALTYNT